MIAGWAEFSERHFELACNVELLGSSTSFSAPSTNVERDLGYDVCMNPAVWPSLQTAPVAMAEGASSTPVAAPSRAFPSSLPAPPPLFSFASLFVQYKRPFRLETTSSAHGDARAKGFGAANAAPFFRVALSDEQHLTLVRWEEAVRGFGGIVRYAAPRFATWGTLVAHQTTGRIHKHSAWLSPKALGRSLKWTYDPSGLHHMRHSEPVVIEGEVLKDVANNLDGVAVRGGVNEIRRHLADLANVASETVDVPDLRRAIWDRTRYDDGDAFDALVDFATVQFAAASHRLSWAFLVRRHDTAGTSTVASLREMLALGVNAKR